MSIYSSVTDYISSLPLSKASMTINEIRLESAVPGFKVHSVTGRDSMQQQIEEIESKIVDGTFYRSKRLPARDLEVEFALIRDNEIDFHDAYTKLRGILYSAENAHIEFDDEPNVYYIGTVTNLTSEKLVYNTDSQGTFTIHCASPFKYGKELIEVEQEVDPDDSTSRRFVIDYTGTYRSYPIIEAAFSGDCGYVGFTDGYGALQFGDPNESDTGDIASTRTINILQYSKGSSLTASAVSSLLSGSNKNTAAVIPLGVLQNGNLIHQPVKKNAVKTYDSKGNVVRTTDFDEHTITLDPGNLGSPDASHIWVGSGFKKAFSTTAVDFFALAQIAMSALKRNVNQQTSKETDPRQVGMMQFVVADASGNPILGMVFLKNNQSTSCEIRLYAGTTELTTDRVDGEKNKNLNVYADSLKNKYLFWDHGDFSMKKIGDTVDFYVDHRHHTFKASAVPAVRAIINKAAATINFFIGHLDTTGVSGQTYGVSYYPLREMNIRGFGAEKYNAPTQGDVPNKFMNQDLLEIDTDEGTIKLNGILRDDLGAIGNEWDEFCLRPGANIIKIAKSGWAAYPTCTLKYRKVYV